MGCIFVAKLERVVYNFAMRWFYTEEISSTKAILHGDEAKHLSSVLRARVGEKVVCFDGKGTYAECEIETISKNNIELFVQKLYKQEPKTSELVLVSSAIKGERQDILIRQAVELGVTKIVLVETEHSEAKLKIERIDKIQRQIVACCKQCHSAILPKIAFDGFKEIVQKCNNFVKIFGKIGSKQRILELDFGKVTNKSVAIFVGPEGGFSNDEEHFLEKSGAVGVSLGSNILRADTASAMLVSTIKAIKKW